MTATNQQQQGREAVGAPLAGGPCDSRRMQAQRDGDKRRPYKNAP